jgi:adenylosuccinate lyase
MAEPLLAISPIDGRYHSKLRELSAYFSEYALIRYRIEVELAYFNALADVGFFSLSREQEINLQQRLERFSEADAQLVKQKEKETNHDVKAMEYLVKSWVEAEGLGAAKEWVHFGLTSQDINNTALPMMIRDSIQEVIQPELMLVLDRLQMMAEEWADIPMLARTHGQPASPTRLGKEMMVFVERLNAQLAQLASYRFSGKFGGATGNFNAHAVAFPQVDWKAFADRFMEERLDLHRQQYTTQIEHYDQLAALFDLFQRINCILLDLCRDLWQYISMDYFSQQIKAGEVGSSAMPHKVNPIDFENAEGNLGLANAFFDHLARKLPISRLQRDLTDSTVIRNVGVPFAHTLLALKSLTVGLSKLKLNVHAIEKDLLDNPMVVAEAIQTILRAEGYPNPYEKLRDFTRGQAALSQQDIELFIHSLDISEELKARLLSISPLNYTGI